MTLWRHWIVGQLDATIVAAVLLLIAVIARHQLSPRVRSALLLIALVRLVLPPWIRSPWSEALVDFPPLDDGRMGVAIALQHDAALYIAAITSIVSMILIARFGRAIVGAHRRWISTSNPAAEATQRRCDELTPPHLGSIEVRLSQRNEGPLAAGLRRRIIVLPAIVESLPDAALDAVLAHEIAHHARRDLWWIAAATILRSIAWFNPLAHVIARALLAAREDGSDDWAIARTSGDPFTYARALLQSARMVAVPQPLATAGAHPMGLRLRRLLDGGSVTGDRLGWIGIVIVVIAAAAALPGAHMPSAGQGDDRVVIVIRR